MMMMSADRRTVSPMHGVRPASVAKGKYNQPPSYMQEGRGTLASGPDTQNQWVQLRHLKRKKHVSTAAHARLQDTESEVHGTWRASMPPQFATSSSPDPLRLPARERYSAGSQSPARARSSVRVRAQAWLPDGMCGLFQLWYSLCSSMHHARLQSKSSPLVAGQSPSDWRLHLAWASCVLCRLLWPCMDAGV